MPVNNYRAVSIICNFSKIIEIIILSIIFNDIGDLIASEQYGFVSRRLCLTYPASLS